MVDVMLVLLIIFMVITPMLTKGVSVDLVKTKNPIAMPAQDKRLSGVNTAFPGPLTLVHVACPVVITPFRLKFLVQTSPPDPALVGGC